MSSPSYFEPHTKKKKTEVSFPRNEIELCSLDTTQTIKLIETIVGGDFLLQGVLEGRDNTVPLDGFAFTNALRSYRSGSDEMKSFELLINSIEVSLLAGCQSTAKSQYVAGKIANWLQLNYIKLKPVIEVYIETSLTQSDMPYQNNMSCVKSMANVLLANTITNEVRSKRLVTNFAYFGFGKTRLGIEFLSLFKRSLNDTSIYTSNLTFNEYVHTLYPKESIDNLLNSKLVFINCARLATIVDFETLIISYICATLNIKPPILNTTLVDWLRALEEPIFIVLDEFQVFMRDNTITPLENYYKIWATQICKLQELNNVFLYICGKGILFELIGNNVLSETYRSPTLVHGVNLKSLSEECIVNILKDSKNIPNLFACLNNSNNVEEFAKFVQEISGGIPILVHEIITAPYLKTYSLEECKEMASRRLDTLPASLITPYVALSLELKNIYKVFVWSCVLNKQFSKDEKLNISLLKEIKEFAGLQQINIVDLAIFCNSYIEETTEDKLRFVFPKFIIEKYVQSNEAPDVSFIYQAAKRYPQLIDTGDVLEYLVSIRLQILLSTNTQTQIGGKIPFFIGTPLAEAVISIPESPLMKIESFGKVTSSSSKTTTTSTKTPTLNHMNTWPDIINHLKTHTNTLYKFETGSHSPDTIMAVKYKESTYYLCFQEKNETKVCSFTKIKQEVEKTVPLLEHSNEFVILSILARQGSDYDCGVYTDTSLPKQTNGRKRNEENMFVQVPKNFYLVIVSPKQFSDFVGAINANALTNLPKWKKQTFELGEMVEFIVSNQ